MLEPFESFWDEHLGTVKTATDRIEITSPYIRPINSALYHEKPKVRESELAENDRTLKKKVIEPNQMPWANLSYVYPKNDGTLRLCVDHQKLNAVVVRESYSLPRTDEYIDLLGDSQVLLTLDTNSGY